MDGDAEVVRQTIAFLAGFIMLVAAFLWLTR